SDGSDVSDVSDGSDVSDVSDGVGRVGRVGQFWPATEQNGFRYRYPGCSYSSEVTRQEAKNGKSLV
ncbi:MAG: hypothetical protein GX561_13295, partial [Lentisphaerae bacterium]|nr:hypothetical protein [Lentisphaerota bacterium]